MKYIVICYAIHERKIVSYDPFVNVNDALIFIKKDAEKLYNEEIYNGNSADIDLDEGFACVKSNKEYEWTWEIIIT